MPPGYRVLQGAFDQTYEGRGRSSSRYRGDEVKVALLGDAKTHLAARVAATFDALERTGATFDIKGLYSIDEKTIALKKIEILSVPAELRWPLDGLDSLKTLERRWSMSIQSTRPCRRMHVSSFK